MKEVELECLRTKEIFKIVGEQLKYTKRVDMDVNYLVEPDNFIVILKF